MTDAEQVLWRRLRSKQLSAYRFRRQHPIGRYVLDFYCPSARLAIELDGGQHGTPEGESADSERTSFLTEHGIHVVRFWNNDVLRNTEGVAERILDLLPPIPMTHAAEQSADDDQIPDDQSRFEEK